MDADNPLAATAVPGDVERLVVVFGDQLDSDSPALRHLDSRRDAVLMMEVREEATHVPSHAQRTALFLSAMRHFALHLQRKKIRVRYVPLDESSNTQTLTDEVGRAIAALRPDVVRLVFPGEHRVFREVRRWERRFGTPVEVLDDTHFLTDAGAFQQWLSGRRRPLMDHFYREQRRRLGILLTDDDKPVGGSWSFDADNRQAFREAPEPPPRPRFRRDATTREVLDLVCHSLPDAPGSGKGFSWPVTRAQAKRALADFVDNRLADFGTHQDAMWAGQPFLYHSRPPREELSRSRFRPPQPTRGPTSASTWSHPDWYARPRPRASPTTRPTPRRR